MPDITMCLNDGCPMCDICYRFLATPSHYQTYAFFEVDEIEECEHFMEIY